MFSVVYWLIPLWPQHCCALPAFSPLCKQMKSKEPVRTWVVWRSVLPPATARYLRSLSRSCWARSCFWASSTLPSMVSLAHSWAQWTPNTSMFRLPAHTQLQQVERGRKSFPHVVKMCSSPPIPERSSVSTNPWAQRCLYQSLTAMWAVCHLWTARSACFGLFDAQAVLTESLQCQVFSLLWYT